MRVRHGWGLVGLGMGGGKLKRVVQVRSGLGEMKGGMEYERR